MGCEFNFTGLQAKSNEDALKEGNEVIQQHLYSDGHGGYTGTFAEAQGCEIAIPPVSVVDEESAEDWLDETALKWGPALLIKAADGNYYMGAHCSS